MPARAHPPRTPHRCRGSYTAYRAVFERYGVIEAEDPDEAVAIAGVLLTCPLPKGRRIGIITPSGGGGAWMADTLSLHGLIVPPLSAATQATLRAVMPSYGASGNPVDVTAQGSNTGPALMTAMETLAGSDEIDMLVLITSLTSETRVSLDAERVRATAARCGKPMTVWTYTLPSEFGRDASRPGAGCSCTAICAMSAWRWAGLPLTRRRRRGPCPPRRTASPASPLPAGSAACADRASRKGAAGALWFAGVAANGWRLRRPRRRRLPNALGYPVALKIASPDLPHKTEAGGVVLGLQGQHSVTAAYDADRRRRRSATVRTRASTACWCRRWRRAGMNW